MTLTRRKPLKPTGPPRRRKPLKTRRKDPVTAATRALMWQRASGRCEIGITQACRKRHRHLLNGWQYSHRLRRREPQTHGPECGLVSCAECHAWLPTAARRWVERCGWLLPFATPDPATVPTLLPDRRWVLLTKAGTYDELGEAA